MKTILFKYKNNILINYIFTFFKNFDLTHGIWMIYLALKGMSLTELGILEGVFHITSFFMETPTGIIADLYGRKISRIAGIFMNIIFLILILFGSNFFIFLIAFSFCALSFNLESGAGEALVYESLLKLKSSEKFIKVQGINEFIIQISSAFSLILGGTIAVYNYKLLFSICIMVNLINVFIVIFLKETLEIKNKLSKANLLKGVKSQYSSCFYVIKNHKQLLFLILYTNIIGCFVTCTFFYSQNYWKNFGISESIIGISFAIFSIGGGLGGILAHKFDEFFGIHKILKLTPILICICFWMYLSLKLSIFMVILLGFLDSIIYVIASSYINKLLPNEQRATVISFSSTIFSFYMILLFPAMGLIGDIFGLKISFLVIAIISTIFAIMINIKKKFN